MKFTDIFFTATERFLRYVRIDTQSDASSTTCPSTEKQKNLGRILVEELLELGISDAHLDEHGYVYATIPSNSEKKVPVICFCSHMDPSPDCSGLDVKPIIHKNYQGQDLILPDDNTQVIRMKEFLFLLWVKLGCRFCGRSDGQQQPSYLSLEYRPS